MAEAVATGNKEFVVYLGIMAALIEVTTLVQLRVTSARPCSGV